MSYLTLWWLRKFGIIAIGMVLGIVLIIFLVAFIGWLFEGGPFAGKRRKDDDHDNLNEC